MLHRSIDRSRPLRRRFGARLVSGLCVGSIVAFFSAVASAADPLQFSVLAYNTHGLPGWIARDQPAQRYEEVAKLAAPYDIILFQEDFVEDYSRVLQAGLPGRFFERGNGSRSGWLSLAPMFCGSCGSGLATSVQAQFKTELVAREAYGNCSGWAGSGNDCWATKGYMVIRVALPNGNSVDVYTLHFDAGKGLGDHDVRTAQIEVLRGAIEQYSSGRALIVGGDFNLDSRTPRDRILLDRFAADLRLLPSGAGGSATKWTEQIDHIFYRSGDGATLKVVTAGEAKEFVSGSEKKPLSDHPAIFARFEAK